MARKYVCDNCGKEFDSKKNSEGNFNVYEVRWEEGYAFGEYCRECRMKIESLIKAGVN